MANFALIKGLIMGNTNLDTSLQKALEIIKIKKGIDFSEYNISANKREAKGYKIEKNGCNINVDYCKKSDFFHGIMTALSTTEDLAYESVSFNDELGVMIDCARNGVMKVSRIKDLVVDISLMGYTYIGLYVEDCIKIDDEQFFGYMRGAYTKEEIKEIDEFCKIFDIELIPYIQTLAHLNQLFRWPEYKSIHDCNDILLIDDEKTYMLLDKIIAYVSQTFSSNKLNIGMDEAHMLGCGAYLDKNDYHQKYPLFLKHLEKVMQICNKYNRNVSMWSDMFFRTFFNDYYVKSGSFNQEVKNSIPSGVTLFYWDYYHSDKKDYDEMFKLHKQITNKLMFAGGIWTWRGFSPYNAYTEQTMKPAMASCRDNDISNVLMTMWSDNGGECSKFSGLSSAMFVADSCRFETVDYDLIDKKMLLLTGYTRKDFLCLDLPNILYDGDSKYDVNPSKYLLYSDIFCSYIDGFVKESFTQKYLNYEKVLSRLARKNSPYGYLFNTQKELCSVLSVKAELAIKLKKAYSEKDIKMLKKIISEINTLIKKVKKFYDAFRSQWYTDNKGNGFEVQDIRIGGLIQRLKNNKKILSEFVKGKISSIEELEEERHTITQRSPMDSDNLVMINDYGKIATVNIL